MKKISPHVTLPRNTQERCYLANLPAKFYMVLRDFPCFPQEVGSPDRFRAGDIYLDGMAHHYAVRVGTHEQPTRYWMNGRWLGRQYEVLGYLRPLSLPELLKLIPHMTERIWRVDGQYALRDIICRGHGTHMARWAADKYGFRLAE